MGALDDRKDLAVKLIGQRKSDSENPYFPFNFSSYKGIDLNQDDWQKILDVGEKDPSSLISSNPFQRSAYRDGFAVWDAAVGIPESSLRGPVCGIKNLVNQRLLNTEWSDDTMIRLNRVGKIGDTYVRPSGDYVFDLMYDENGWKILELAHLLTHRLETAGKRKPYSYGSLGNTYLTTVLKLTTAIQYDLPVNIRGSSAEDAFDAYGILLCASSKLRAPVLAVPVMGPGSMIPDKTFCVLCGGVHIEPHPYSINKGSDKWLEINRWSCEPTLTVLAGWELPDVVSHQQLVRMNPFSETSPVLYGMQPTSLMPMKTFPDFLASAKADRLVQADGKDIWNVLDYLKSEDFEESLLQAPTLPCDKCLKLNMMTEGSPMRPKCERPEEKIDKAETEEEKQWKAWDDSMNKILKIVREATEFYEYRLVGKTKAKRIRRLRNKNYRDRMKNESRKEFLLKKRKRLLNNGYLTEAAKVLEEIKQMENP